MDHHTFRPGGWPHDIGHPSLLAASVLLTLASLCPANTVYLHNGRKFQGKIASKPDARVVTIDTAMGLVQIKPTEILPHREGRCSTTRQTQADPKVVRRTIRGQHRPAGRHRPQAPREVCKGT